MPSPAILSFFKEFFTDKGAIFSHLKRNKIVWLLLTSHLVMLVFLLFLSEQAVQKENQLVDARRDWLSAQGTVEKLASCETDLVISDKHLKDTRDSLDLAQSDYRELKRTVHSCVTTRPPPVAPSPPPKTPQEKRPTAHPPRRIVKQTVPDYQSALEGL